ncbi:MAG: hypothetical protein O2999_00690 [Nitrospirae bacterium]|nr:hypothetical protein [Nitrospirota bacterium]MDA1302821.1 hypothetical protein [Nitrospirota bacterium]
MDYPKLLSAAKRGVQHKQVLRSVRKAREEASQRERQLAAMEETLSVFGGIVPEAGVEAALLNDPQTQQLKLQVEGLTRALDHGDHSLHGPQESSVSVSDYLRLRDGIYETIQVLQKTKGAFHSKDLARLRIYLQDLLRDTKVDSSGE